VFSYVALVAIIVIDGYILKTVFYTCICVSVVAFNDSYLWVIVLDDNRMSGFCLARPSDKSCCIKIFTRFIINDFSWTILA